MKAIQYYGIVAKGRGYAEVLVSVVPGQKSTQEETGVTYKTQREAVKDNERKNLAVARERYGADFTPLSAEETARRA